MISQNYDYFHVSQHHSVTGYSCLMFPLDPSECDPLFEGVGYVCGGEVGGGYIF